jgi:hypothetical protein
VVLEHREPAGDLLGLVVAVDRRLVNHGLESGPGRRPGRSSPRLLPAAGASLAHLAHVK